MESCPAPGVEAEGGKGEVMILLSSCRGLEDFSFTSSRRSDEERISSNLKMRRIDED